MSVRKPRSDKGRQKFTDAEILARFRTSETGCHIWTGDTNSWGYGRVGHGRPERSAHRLSYHLHSGPIPDGMSVLHRCDTPACINPTHLFLGTTADNMRDMQSKGRSGGNAGKSGTANATAKLTQVAAEAIRASDKTISALAREYGVSRRAVCFVREGITWAR